MEQTTPAETFASHRWKKAAVALLSLLLLFVAFSGKLDDKGRRAVDDSFNQALITFGTARALNAVISLAQGTEVGPPGVTIAVGEVLDPVNDLIERFSWVMLAAATSLGIQSILMNIVTDPRFNYLLAALILAGNVLLFVRFEHDARTRTHLLRFTLLLLFLRFSIPLMAVANDLTYTHFVEQQYNIVELDRGITTISDDLGTLKADGYRLFDSDYYSEQIARYKTQAGEAADRIVKLIMAFVFQTIVFPLVFLVLVYRVGVKYFYLTP